MIPHILTDRSLTVVLGASPFAVPRDHCNFGRILDALRSDADVEAVRRLVDVPATVADFTRGKIAIYGRDLYFDGARVHNGLAKRILDLVAVGDEALADPLCQFLDRIMSNPCERTKTGLYDWLAASELPITEDGCFIAWKIVGPDYRPISTRGPHRDEHIPDGRYISMPREECDPSPDALCSSGLHFCSSSYLPRYGNAEGNHVVVLKIDPKDVVAFPRDEGLAKGRACGYWVIDEVAREAAPTRFDGQAVVETPPPFPWTHASSDSMHYARALKVARWERTSAPMSQGHVFNVFFDREGTESGPFWYTAEGKHAVDPLNIPSLVTKAEPDFPFVAAVPAQDDFRGEWTIKAYRRPPSDYRPPRLGIEIAWLVDLSWSQYPDYLHESQPFLEDGRHYLYLDYPAGNGWPTLVRELPVTEAHGLAVDPDLPMRLSDGRKVTFWEREVHYDRVIIRVQYPDGQYWNHFADTGEWCGDPSRPRLENYTPDVEELLLVEKSEDGALLVRTNVMREPTTVSGEVVAFLPTGRAEIDDDGQAAIFGAGEDTIKLSLGYLKKLAA